MQTTPSIVAKGLIDDNTASSASSRRHLRYLAIGCELQRHARVRRKSVKDDLSIGCKHRNGLLSNDDCWMV